MSWSRFAADIGLVLWLSLPMVAANMLPVVFGKHGTPIDNDWRPNGDGYTLFGAHKTWQGFFGGVLGGAAVSALALIVAGLSHSRLLVHAWGDGPWVRI